MNVILLLCDTLRRDHCSPYHLGRKVSEMDPAQSDWVVPTPNLDRLAARGTVYDNAWCGSSPCMPARRDIYTGRFEFLERGWGPLEDDDKDLPRQISGPIANSSLAGRNRHISYLVSDHFHLWEQGSGNYHMGYSGFQFIRGFEADAYATDPIDFPLPTEAYRKFKVERHYRNTAVTDRGGRDESKSFIRQSFDTASDWLERNRTRRDFFLHIDSFSPHEPWDPPERLLKLFDPRGYDVPEYFSFPPYQPVSQSGLTPDQVRHSQALYAASVVRMDECLGQLMDKMDQLDLWKETLFIFTTDHGTYNGSRGLLGKLQTHQFDQVAHIPMILAHPELAHGERRTQLVQLVDLYPTTLEATGCEVPAARHGVSLLPSLRDPEARTRRYALAGIFGNSVSITDGRWILHQQPREDNQPLYWYSHRLPMFMRFEVGKFCEEGRRPVRYTAYPGETWLCDRANDPTESTNLASSCPEDLARMQMLLADVLEELGAPPEQTVRLGMTSDFQCQSVRAESSGEKL